MAFLIALSFLFLYMSAAFVMAVRRFDNSIADSVYGGGFVLVAWTTYVLGFHSISGLIISLLVSIWALRLSVRIIKRNWNQPEDFRYAQWRKEWGTKVVSRSFLQIFMLQGAIIFLVSLPVILLNVFGQELGFGLLGGVGLLLWVIGFVFEFVGDRQLELFLKKPESTGKIMQSGLWKYTRHPNYFGESCLWWGVSLVAFDTLVYVVPLPLALLVFIGPSLITYLLLRVSGVPLLEARLEKNPEWAAYKNKTSVFFPLPPKKTEGA